MTKLLLLVMACLCMGLSVGCGPEPSEVGREVAGVGETAVSEPTLVLVRDVGLGTRTIVPLPTDAPSTPSIPGVTLTITALLAHTPMPPAMQTAVPTATHLPVETSSSVPEISSTQLTSPGLVQRGLQVYQQWYCGVCHQLDAAGTGGQFGPTHDHMGMTAGRRIHVTEYTGTAKTAAEYIRESIVNPGVFLVPGYENSPYHMPAFTNLNEADLDALVEMLLQQN